MGARLTTWVHVVERPGEGSLGRSAMFGPDDDLSDPDNAWALAAIENPDVWDGDPPAGAGSAVVRERVEEPPAGVGDTEAGDVADRPPVPPRRGAGSTAQAWREYAQALGVEVDEDAGRDDIIAALDAAGHPTE